MADEYLLIPTGKLETVDVDDILPKLATTDAEKIDALLDVLSDPSNFTGDEDIDLVRDAALCGLLEFEHLPDRTIDIMLVILADEDDSDLTLARKMAACDVLGHTGEQSSVAIPVLVDLLPLAESNRNFERWLALRASTAVWKTTNDPQSAIDVARKLAEDEQTWLTIHAENLLREIDSAM